MQMIIQIDDKHFSSSSNEFEQLYFDLRIQEKRMYTDDEVMWLPDVNSDHIHRNEWKIRKTSCQRLTRYLANKKKPLKILEVGCGNGWLSYHLSQIPNSNVVGLDVNFFELQQASRVFAATPNLRFVYSDLNEVQNDKFDIIVFAASIQYFRSFSDIIQSALNRLNTAGEVHIIDSHFYYQTEVEDARQRSREYFDSKGFDKMDGFYFHHTLKNLDELNAEILYNPNSLINRILKKRNPFHWVCIKK
ncbi:MAG TPA: class I SAM-dependent methyltransferase [Flavisolibacter sp.]|jgi:ubiquinone/menaquinone biosynthesis C-methylase UbiE|nr:class I SAM-dependent methyltransferase [Flavisolibacter sp.]